MEETPRTTFLNLAADLNVSHMTVSRHFKAIGKVKKIPYKLIVRKSQIVASTDFDIPV